MLYILNFLPTTHNKGENHGLSFLNSRGAHHTLREGSHHSITPSVHIYLFRVMLHVHYGIYKCVHNLQVA